MEIIFTTVSTPLEVQQILDLQAANHVSSVSAAVAQEQGFVTVKHDPAVLQRMNEEAPSVIAKDGDKVVGYALVMPRSFSAFIPILQPMFHLLDALSWKGQSLKEHPGWFVMGQICVAEGYRGKGIFDGMYAKMKEVCQKEYDFVITEIAVRNQRSQRAHERVGFQTMHTFSDAIAREEWNVVIWEF
ncbi:MAG: GNAT family N-acetyltransferase [Saprospiraceae bacterium]|nr:GNAT family N-acetyltransferase [Saprospiraceae bacterium]